MSWFKKTEPGDSVDSGMKTYKVPGDRLVMIEARPGEIIPCDDPQKVVIVPPKDPDPDLATKPKDLIGYCFGYACPNKHIAATFESITIDGFDERRPCQECGELAKPAVIKRTAEPLWGDVTNYQLTWRTSYLKPKWGWYNSSWDYLGRRMTIVIINSDKIYWTRYEFVRFLDSPKPRRKK